MVGELRELVSQGVQDNVLLLDEILRLQFECYREECLRKQLCFIGRDWSLCGESMVKPSNDGAIRALSPNTASEARGAIADIVDYLEFTGVWRGMW